jgi:hypothetical protein
VDLVDFSVMTSGSESECFLSAVPAGCGGLILGTMMILVLSLLLLLMSWFLTGLLLWLVIPTSLLAGC